MDIFLLILLFSIGIFILLEILFTKTGKYLTCSYKFNPYIDNDECIELLICDPYLKKKTFFINYKYSSFLEKKENICVSFIKIPLFHRKPRITNLFIGNEKVKSL